MTTEASGASSRPQRTHVHHGQVSRGFKVEAGAYPGRLVRLVGTTAIVERLPDGSVATFEVALPEELASTLEREDLTRLNGAPFVLASPNYGVLGIGTGPATAPAQLRVVFVSRLEGGHAVEIPSDDDEQPSFQLFAVRGLPA
jgi:hypothetical protein